jgi:hypothetical protein
MTDRTMAAIMIIAAFISGLIIGLGPDFSNNKKMKTNISAHNYAEFEGKVYYCQEFSFRKEEPAK